MRLASLAFLTVLAGILPARAADAPVELVIADTRVQGASEAAGAAMTQALAEYAANLGMHVTTQDELRKLATFDALKQGLGCESEDCDAARAIGDVAKASRLLVPTLSQVGESRVVSLVLFDTASGKVLRRASRELGDDSQVLDGSRDASHVLLTGKEREKPAASGGGKVPRVAVLYFDDNSKSEELAPLRKGLAEMLVSDLGRSDNVQLVERARLEEVLGELKLQKTKAFDAASSAQVGKLLVGSPGTELEFAL